MGFFDRLLAAARPAAVRVGVGFTHRLVPQVPREPHDVPMHWLATETGMLACRHDTGPPAGSGEKHR
jgi:5-formyltetrahydrofolate cyclo-ligase